MKKPLSFKRLVAMLLTALVSLWIATSNFVAALLSTTQGH